MKITAYKDPITGVLFESKASLSTFQSNRKREEAADLARRKEQALKDSIRETLCRELSYKDELIGLAWKMYEHALNTAKRKRNKEPLKVVDIRISNWSVSTCLTLSMAIEVEVSGKPHDTYQDAFSMLTPPDVLYPFSLRGCGNSDDSKGKFVYRYGISTELSKLPRLLKSMQSTAKLLRESDIHDKRVDEAATQRKAKDEELAQLTAATADAKKVFEAAQVAYLEAAKAQNQRAERIEQESAKSMPFYKKDELATLCSATGMPAVGQSDRWLSLQVRNRLLDSIEATA